MRFVALRAHTERLVSLKKRDIKLYVMCHTAKAYFPDRQSCSTLCRQPYGCARSVEVVAVYPSLGSYSVVVFLVGITSFQKCLSLNTQKCSCKVTPNPKTSFRNLLFAQKSYSVFVDYSVLILPSIYKGMGKVKSKPEIQFF